MAKLAFVNSSKNKPVLSSYPWSCGSNPTKNAKLHLNLPNPLSDARFDSAQQIAEKIAASLHH
jgi:hypothetical protein